VKQTQQGYLIVSAVDIAPERFINDEAAITIEVEEDDDKLFIWNFKVL